MNVPPDQRAFLPGPRAAQRGSAAASATPGGDVPATQAPDPRVPLQWQGSAGFRAAHIIAAAWVLACLAVGVGVYAFAVRDDRASVAAIDARPVN